MARTTTLDPPVAVGSRDAIPSLIKRNTFLLATAQAFVGVGNQMVPTLGAIMVVHLLGAATLAGLGTSLLNVSKFLVAYPIGWITDTFGRRVGLLIGLNLSLLGTISIGVAMLQHSFPLFLAGLLVFGLGVGAGQQLRLAAADMYLPARRAEGLGYVLTGSLVGAIGGPLLILSAQNMAPGLGLDPTALAWFLVPIVLVPSMGLVLLVRPDPKDIATNLQRYYPGAVVRDHAAASETGAGFRTWVAQYPLRVAFFSSFAVQGTMTMMMAMTSLALAHHGHGLPVISLSVSIHVVGMYGLSIPLGRLTDRLGRRNVMLMGIILTGVGSVLVPTTPEYWIITTGTFLVGVGWSCVNVSASALIADRVGPLERGRAIGTNDTFSGGAAMLFPLAGGPIVEILGLPTLAVVGVGLMITPLVMLLRLSETSPGRYTEAAATT